MKKIVSKLSLYDFIRNRSLFLMGLLILFIPLKSIAQTRINAIDGIYIERTYWIESPEEPDSGAKIPEVEPYEITQTNIVNGDVIAFDIPGINDFMQENKKSMKNVILKIDDLELPEFPAYIESAESDVVRFRFATRKLKYDNRKILYMLPGKATKEVLLGIKIDESNILFNNEPASLYFKEIKRWGSFGWVLIIAFFLFFALLIFRYKSVIKDSVRNLTDDLTINTYYSFSKSQFAFWTFIIMASFIYIWAFTGDLQSINNTALILLGITSLTITASNLIHTGEESRNDKAKLLTIRTKSSKEKTNFLEDILSDANGISIHRLQAVIFNLIFGIAFLKSVWLNYAMPEFSEAQLILLGLSNGTYAFLKNLENK